MIVINWSTQTLTTYNSIGDCVAVGSELRVDIGEEPAERSTLESGPQGFPLRNVPDVYSWVLERKQTYLNLQCGAAEKN